MCAHSSYSRLEKALDLVSSCKSYVNVCGHIQLKLHSCNKSFCKVRNPHAMSLTNLLQLSLPKPGEIAGSEHGDTSGAVLALALHAMCVRDGFNVDNQHQSGNNKRSSSYVPREGWDALDDQWVFMFTQVGVRVVYIGLQQLPVHCLGGDCTWLSRLVRAIVSVQPCIAATISNSWITGLGVTSEGLFRLSSSSSVIYFSVYLYTEGVAVVHVVEHTFVLLQMVSASSRPI